MQGSGRYRGEGRWSRGVSVSLAVSLLWVILAATVAQGLVYGRGALSMEKMMRLSSTPNNNENLLENLPPAEDEGDNVADDAIGRPVGPLPTVSSRVK